MFSFLALVPGELLLGMEIGSIRGPQCDPGIVVLVGITLCLCYLISLCGCFVRESCGVLFLWLVRFTQYMI